MLYEYGKYFPKYATESFMPNLFLKGTRPDNIRSGQAYYINLELVKHQMPFLFLREASSKSTGGSWIFVLDPEWKRAYRRKK